ncbi:LANO_0E03752g1_1 [Lachancea nothofagi CBS 11611]|uniref:LANO_0E03752g1_1 n=1 Tax=Lachancea nothofagi CBS 11611 TaxID=1266666 RepID=A0A1G4JRT4_9SACH|nr:LANO_0E03752g1_1 [Lachancea nothofagi CBS 11611]
MFDKTKVDYSLYLVTDSTMLPPGTTLESQVYAALQNGVTLVQLREKDTDTKIFIQHAVKVQKLCREFKVPLIINDRVDVALAIDADGVHVGQGDMPISMVRKLVGPDKIVGWSVGYEHEVQELAAMGPQGVDYVGLGMVFPTNTKKNPKKSPMGPRGVSKLLDTLQTSNATWCRTVAIGGLHPDNIPRVLSQMCSNDGKRSVDGIAVVSDIMASSEAGKATKRLRNLIDSKNYQYVDFVVNNPESHSPALEKEYIQVTTLNSPLIHHITNKVHYNFGANVALALGSSPIMSEIESEFVELSQVPHATLLLNTGSVAPLESLTSAMRAYNSAGRPIVFDPVGFSATSVRLQLNSHLLAYGQFACIKGNAGEILSLADLNTGKMRGVDSGDNGSNLSLLVEATKIVAFRYRCVAVCTGKIDVVADGTCEGKFKLSSGSPLIPSQIPAYKVECGDIPVMGRITASGCSLGTTIACLVGGLSKDQSLLSAVLTAVRLYKSAGYLASSRCEGSGSFQVRLIDALDQMFQGEDPQYWKATLSSA